MLKSLELFGFKSFADRTAFEFSAGITCIVGPNGSGKSNVVDAIKWLLGDQSAKSLRGKEMTDVIFNGSASRKPAGYAEALLTFDNHERKFNIDTDEVLVGRRLYRNGEAEYLINRSPVRLKDVKELFMGTGAGTSAYSIIEQGRVDALLQATNQNRRNVFEEAAGISKFNARKNEALRKLERVGQNLLRLNDIVEEVRGQLNTLRSQASKASKFREYTEELKQLRIGLSADDYRVGSYRLTQLQAEQEQIATGLKQVVEQHHVVETEQSQVDSQVADCEDRLRAVEREAAENREAIATHEATIGLQTARKQELEAEVLRLQQQQNELQARAAEATGEWQQAEGNLQSILTTFSERQTELSAREQTLQQLSENLEQSRSQLDRNREEQLELIQQGTVLRNRVGSLEAQHAALETSRQRALSRRSQLEQDLAVARADWERRQEGVSSAVAATQAQKDHVQGFKVQREEVLLRQEEVQRNLAQHREQRSAGLARKTLLEDLERRQEGLGVGVKEILTRARELQTPPWTTVLGSVADLLSVENEQAAVLEVALGTRAQVIVLSEYGPLLEYLHDGRCQLSGRVGFLALGGPAAGQVIQVDPEALKRNPALAVQSFATDLLKIRRPVAELDLHELPGVTCRADRLIKTASGWPKLAERLLCDTWIVESLAVAFRLATQQGRGARFVTLQGELLEEDGTLYVGTVRSETALVSRKSELRSLKNDLIRLDRQIQQDELHMAQLAQQVVKYDQDIVAAMLELERLADQLSELKSGISGQEMQLDRLSRDLGEVQAEILQIDADQQQLVQGGLQNRADLQQIDARLEQLKAAVVQVEQSLLQQEAQLREGQQGLNQEQLELAKQEERLQSLKHARARLDQERFQRDLQKEEAERRFQQIQAKTEQIEQHLQTTQTAVATLLQQREQLEQQVAQRQAERNDIRLRRSQLSEQELTLRHQRREWQDRQHALELQSRDIRQQLQHLAERLLDEYQVDLAQAAASGKTALTRYLPEPPDAAVEETEPEAADADDEEVKDETAASETVEAALELVHEALQEAPETPPPAEIDPALRSQIEEDIDRLRRKLKLMGQVNTDSLRDLDDLESRYERLNAQLQDLVEAKAALEEIVRRINIESRRMFIETFQQIREQFQELFRKLFGGGEGDIVLEDPDNVLECGIDVVARPPGKELRSITLLSGGEKTMTAVALLMAIFKSRPSPFCILDEVDAALDEGNVERYMKVVQEFREWTQFIVITHSKRTMSTGDVLYGVTMEESGISKRMSVRFDDISDDGNFRTDGTSQAA